MAIRDLLWICPICGNEGSLAPARRGDACRVCRTSFSRGRRAQIVAHQPGKPPIALSPAEWLDRLPDLGVEDRIAGAAADGGVVLREPAILRTEVDSQPVYFRGTYLNRIERLGPPVEGVLELGVDRLSFRPGVGSRRTETTGGSERAGSAGDSGRTGSADDAGRSEVAGGVGVGPGHPDGGGGGDAAGAPIVVWDFDLITAVQPSSSTLQINARGIPLSSLRVPEGSIRLWEEFICTALRIHYRRVGRGEIIEFQPRISTGPGEFGVR